ncbi:KR-domain-containing protein [Daedalea quercina L-15889]|uniref:KR-domain-containing protein n=2 Tax=Daedalea quercina L-15889 TaxID=1314783 RepID=A0A165KHQ4_9APHY|nr:KR-domain-containing protein [Daedalea quercina L-15889]
MREELDIFVTEDGHMLVLRMIPLLDRPSQDEDVNHTDISDEAHEGSILVDVQEAFDETQVVWILGTECNRSQRLANASNNHPHQVIALSKGPLVEFVAVREEVTLHLSPYLGQYATSVVRALPGIVTAILAQGAHTFNNVRRCKGRRVLVTHSNTLTAMMVLWTYQKQGMVVVEIPENATPLQLSSVLRLGFDMIVSGYTDTAYVELLKSSSMSMEGRLYFWNDPRDGLGSVLRNDIWSVQDALKLALDFLENCIEELAWKLHERPVENVHRRPDVKTSKTQRGVVFSPHKTYLVLGGIGNLGVHVTWMLYRHGARHIVVTSRRGASTLGVSANRLVRRMFGYMQSLPDLDLRLSAIDASKADSLAQLLCTLPEDAPLAGCLVLTAILADRTFARLEEADFTQVYESKIGVIDALHDCIDIRTLDFLVPFSSMAGLFGNGGQANYCAANTAMEEQVSAYPNAFAFVCPGIIDSTMMHAGNLGESGKIIQLEQFAQWGITAEEMVLWLEDALRRFQAGERFARYVPTVDWHALERTRGMPLIGRHLISDSHSYVLADGGGVDDAINVGEKMAAVVRAVLGIAEEDFSPQTPFTTYGVDSLSAARLAFMLHPYVEVTQLQLLADMSLKGLEKLTVTSEGGKEACQPE